VLVGAATIGVRLCRKGSDCCHAAELCWGMAIRTAGGSLWAGNGLVSSGAAARRAWVRTGSIGRLSRAASAKVNRRRCRATMRRAPRLRAPPDPSPSRSAGACGAGGRGDSVLPGGAPCYCRAALVFFPHPRSMATLSVIKPAFQRLLRPLVDAGARAGITANQVTVAAMALSLAAGAVLMLVGDRALLLVPIVLLLRMALNAADGMLAREHGQRSRLGAV